MLVRPAPCFVDYGGYFWLFTPVSGLRSGRKGKVRFAPTTPVIAVQEEDLIEDEYIFEEFLKKILRPGRCLLDPVSLPSPCKEYHKG